MNTDLLPTNACTKIYSYVDLTTNNPELSIKAHLGYGFKIHKTAQETISFVKEIIPNV